MEEGVPLAAPGAPIDPGLRIAAIDVLRGVAVLGILLMNIVAMGLPSGAYDDPTVIGNRGPADYWVWAVNAVVAEGKMRAIFSMLFGAGLILIAGRAGPHTDRADLHLRRNLWLVLFGAIHSYLLLWPGEILFTYGVAGMGLFAFRRLRPSRLILLGALILATQAPKVALYNLEQAEASAGLRGLKGVTTAGGTLTADQQRQREGWRETLATVRPAPDALRQGIERRRGGYLANLGVAAAASLYVESLYLYKIGLWDAAGAMLIGMGLFKLEVFSAARSYRCYILMALAGYAVAIPLGVWVVRDFTARGFEPGARWASLDEVTRMAGALGHVAIVMLVCKAGAARWATGPLRAVGRMALTNYVMQTLICVTLFAGFGLGWFGQLARHELYYIVAAVWAVQLLASPLWLRWFRFGPLEWLWRSLTYQQPQPFRLRPGA